MSATVEMRVSDAERERVASRLCAAHVEGRLTLAEYDERVRAAHGAVVRGDLEPLTADLPAPTGTAPTGTAPTGTAPAGGAVDGAGERRQGRPRLPGPAPFPVPPFMAPPFAPPFGRDGLRGQVAAWASASVINVVIWLAVVLGTGTVVHPWWIWVAGPWGLMLAVGALARRAGGQQGVAGRGTVAPGRSA